MSARRSREELPRGPLHAFLVLMVLYTVYPILWVVSIAFSGRQSLAIVDLPPDPTLLDRLRAVIPWPARWSWVNFASVMTDQPFARWILNSAIVALAPLVVARGRPILEGFGKGCAEHRRFHCRHIERRDRGGERFHRDHMLRLSVLPDLQTNKDE